MNAARRRSRGWLWATMLLVGTGMGEMAESQTHPGTAGGGLAWVEECEEDKLTGGKKNCKEMGKTVTGSWTTSCTRGKDETYCKAESAETGLRPQAQLDFTCGHKYGESRKATVSVTGPLHTLRNDWSTYGKMSIATMGRIRAIGDEDKTPLDVGTAIGAWWKWNKQTRLEIPNRKYAEVRRLVERSNQIRMEIRISSVMEERIFSINGNGSRQAIAIAEEECKRKAERKGNYMR